MKGDAQRAARRSDRQHAVRVEPRRQDRLYTGPQRLESATALVDETDAAANSPAKTNEPSRAAVEPASTPAGTRVRSRSFGLLLAANPTPDLALSAPLGPGQPAEGDASIINRPQESPLGTEYPRRPCALSDPPSTCHVQPRVRSGWRDHRDRYRCARQAGPGPNGSSCLTGDRGTATPAPLTTSVPTASTAGVVDRRGDPYAPGAAIVAAHIGAGSRPQQQSDHPISPSTTAKSPAREPAKSRTSAARDPRTSRDRGS